MEGEKPTRKTVKTRSCTAAVTPEVFRDILRRSVKAGETISARVRRALFLLTEFEDAGYAALQSTNKEAA
jgi:hypothetical protein